MRLRFLAFLLLASGFGLSSASQEDSPRIGDPYFHSSGAWGQDFRDQWAFDAIGLSDPYVVWDALGESPSPVIVAVIDTGIDWNHLDLSWGSLWTNDNEIIGNGIDDDGNGYVDDRIGWDFLAGTNQPWDYDGHGTFTSGLIAAEVNNGIGMTGLNPYARIMVLKAVNNFGRTRTAYVTDAIRYAVDNGARVINLSLGGPSALELETAALDYAAQNDVLVVVAAGNEGQDLADYAFVNHPAVITVAAIGRNGERSTYSNWGPQVSIAAPGEDILSLRARATDTLMNITDAYKPGSAIVGPDKRYYRATGTSFAAPFVTGGASLLWSRNPSLTANQVRQALLQSAKDIGASGVDQFTGHGALDIGAAFAADPNASIVAEISSVHVVQSTDGPAAEIIGTATSDRLEIYRVEIGQGETPSSWKPVAQGRSSVTNAALATVSASEFAGASVWTIRLIVNRTGGTSQVTLYRLSLG
ncbi:MULTISPECIES: S8 family peptidase [unclassified Hyphomonas]|uniref:S8 family peptidase n=1 Tax=unclassified Hyphomonas TaxID=2630699 RepID=UPI000458BAAF|nr:MULTISPECIES: S8 family peptidase [unclassified Hyphomonas]KCZ46675.1 hypothetical protein HY17_07980 [Hyphomonas sp. CY54-11-8]